MPQIAEVPGIGNVSFPDEMSLDEIDRQVNDVLPRWKAKRSQLFAERAADENAQNNKDFSPSDWFGANLIAAYDQGPAELRRQASSVAEAVTRPIDPEAAAWWSQKAQNARRDVERAQDLAQTLDPSMAGKLSQSVVSTAVSSAPLMAGGLVGSLAGEAGAIGLSALGGAGQSFGSVYNDAKNAYMERGLSEDEAAKKAYGPATLAGLITAGLTTAFGATGIQSLAKEPAAGQTLKQIVGHAFREAGMEASEEGIDQFSQGVIEQKSYNPNKSWSEITQEALLASIGGGLLGGGLSGLHGTIGRVGESLGRSSEQRSLERQVRQEARNPGVGSGIVESPEDMALQATDPRYAQRGATTDGPAMGRSWNQFQRRRGLLPSLRTPITETTGESNVTENQAGLGGEVGGIGRQEPQVAVEERPVAQGGGETAGPDRILQASEVTPSETTTTETSNAIEKRAAQAAVSPEASPVDMAALLNAVDFEGSSEKTGPAFDTALPDTRQLGGVSQLENSLLTGARESSTQSEAKGDTSRKNTKRFLAVFDTDDETVKFFPVYADTRSKGANVVTSSEPDTKGQRLRKVLAIPSESDEDTPRYQPLASVRLKNAGRSFPVTLTEDQWHAVQTAATAAQEQQIAAQQGQTAEAESNRVDLEQASTVATQADDTPPASGLNEAQMRALWNGAEQSPDIQTFVQNNRAQIEQVRPNLNWNGNTFVGQLRASLEESPKTFEQFYESFDPAGHTDWKQRSVAENRKRIVGSAPQESNPSERTASRPPVTLRSVQEARAFLADPNSGVAPEVGHILGAALDDAGLNKALKAAGFQLEFTNSVQRLGSSAGGYDPVTGTILLTLGISDGQVGAHEIAHHLEQLLPESDRAALRNARTDAIDAELRRKDLTPKQRMLLEALKKGERTSAWFEEQFHNIGPSVIDYYPLTNTSEFFAASFTEKFLQRIKNKEATGIMARVKAMLRALWDWMRSKVGLTNAQEDAFRRLVNGDFDVTSRNGTLYDQRGLLGSLPHVFTSQSQAQAQLDEPHLSQEQLAEIKSQVATQAHLVPQNTLGTLMALPTTDDTAEGVAARELQLLSDLGYASASPQQLAALPRNTEEEVRRSETAANGILNQWERVRSKELDLQQKLGDANDNLARLSQQIGRMSNAQAQEQFLATMRQNLVTGYQRYLANQLKQAGARQTTQGKSEQTLSAASRAMNDFTQSPVALELAINTISEHVPDVILDSNQTPEQMNSEIVAWVAGNPQIFQGVISDQVRNFLLNTEGGNPPLQYPRLADNLRRLRDLRAMGETTGDEIEKFKQWFSTKGNPRTVTPLQYAQAYFRFRTQEAKAARIATTISKEIDENDREARGYVQALDILKTMQGAPEWQNGVGLATEYADVVARDAERRNPITGDTEYVGPVSGNLYRVKLLPDAPVEKENIGNLMMLVNEARQFVANPESDPLLRRSWQKRADFIERFLIDPSLDPAQGVARIFKLGPNGMVDLNVFNGARRYIFQNLTSDIQGTLSSIGGRWARTALHDAMLADQIEQQLEVLNGNSEHGPAAIKLSARRAADAQGYEPGARGVLEWEREVANPIIASQQQAGSNYLRVGDTIPISGKTVKPEDMAAIGLMKKWQNAVLNSAQKAAQGSSLKYYNPVQVEEKLADLTIARNAHGPGPLTMSRSPSQWAQDFSKRWARAEQEDGGTSTAARLKLLQDQTNFRMAALGRVSESSPEFKNRGVLSEVYRSVAGDLRTGKAINNWSELLDAVAQGMVKKDLAPDLATARNQAEKTLLEEIGSDARQFADFDGKPADVAALAKTAKGESGLPKEVIDAITANNSFTKARQGLVAPSTWFEYGLASDSRRASHLSDLKTVLRLRELESLGNLLSAMKDRRTQMLEEANKPGMSALDKLKERRKISAESRKEVLSGKNGIDLYSLDQSIAQLDRVFTELRRLTLEMPENFSTPGIQFLSGVKNYLGSTLLGSAQSIINNMGGSQFLQALVQQKLGQGLPSIILGLGKGGFYTGKQIYNLAGRIALSNPAAQRILRQYSGPLSKFANSLADFGNEWARTQMRLNQLGVSPKFNLQQQLELRRQFPATGGQVSGGDQGIFTELMNRIGSAPGVSHFLQGTRAVFPRIFDQIINGAALDYWSGEHEKLKEAAIKSFGAREASGRPDWNDLSKEENLLTSQELGPIVGNNAGARYLREKFAASGSLDKLLLDYYERYKAAKANGTDPGPLLTPKQDADVFLEWMKAINVGTEGNRPLATKGAGFSGFVRSAAGQFLGFPSKIWSDIGSLLESAPKDNPTVVKALGSVAIMMILGLLVGGINNEIGREVTKALTGETTSRVSLGNVLEAGDASTAGQWAASSLANVIPFIGEPLARAMGGTSNRPLMDLSAMIPLAGITGNAIDAILKTSRTHDATYPAMDFLRRWFPVVRPAIRLIPGVEGDLQARNAQRAVTAAVPDTLANKRQQGGGSAGTAPVTPLTPIMRDLVSAAYSGDQAKVAELYQQAIEEKARQGSANPAQAVATSLESANPMRRVLGHNPSPDEEATIIGRMSGSQKQDYARSVAAFGLIGSLIAAQPKVPRVAQNASGSSTRRSGGTRSFQLPRIGGQRRGRAMAGGSRFKLASFGQRRKAKRKAWAAV